MQLKLLGDYHTHSNYSGDSKTPLEENIKKAIDLGLQQIAVTDHGIKHTTNGMSKKKFFAQVEEVKALQQKYPQIKIFQSIEADLLDRKGTLDLDDDVLACIDFIMMGYHMSSKPTSIASFFYFNLPTMLPKFKPSKAKMEKNTTAYLKCMERYPLSFINHINYKMPVLVRPIAQMAKQTNTLIELNGKRVLFSPQEMEILLEENVDFICNSDAHAVSRIGEINIPMEFIKQYNIPLERIKNINQLPPLKLLK